MNKTFTCTTCGTTRSFLEEFPGSLCKSCWAASPKGQYVPTAEELTDNLIKSVTFSDDEEVTA